MHAVEALIAGIRGAENGTAQLYRRGTSNRATWYADFEASEANSSGADIQLDANGSAVVYVNELVEVQVFDSTGAERLTFVAGANATAVELVSQSFTGVDYTTGQSGGSKPTTVHSALEEWFDSAGARDFLVSVAGSDVRIEDALGDVSGLFYNVKAEAYGAVGNGIVDDTSAIQLAIDAANAGGGGIVYFPAGTYRVVAGLTLKAGTALMGAGMSASIIAIDHAANDLISTAFAGAQDTFLRRLSLRASQANSGNLLTVGSNNARVLIAECSFGDTGNNNGDCIETTGTNINLAVESSRFAVPTTTARAIVTVVTTTSRIATTHFVLAAVAYNTTLIQALCSSASCRLVGCSFDLSAATAGAGFVGFESNGPTVMVGNFFSSISAAGAAPAVACTSTELLEAGNYYSPGLTVSRQTDAASNTCSETTALEDRKRHMADNTTPINIDTRLGGTVVILRSTSAAQTLTFSANPVVRHCRIIYHNNSAGNITLTLVTAFTVNANCVSIFDVYFFFTDAARVIVCPLVENHAE